MEGLSKKCIILGVVALLVLTSSTSCINAYLTNNKVENQNDIKSNFSKDEIYEYVISKSRNLPMKFDPPEKTQIFIQWKELLSELLRLKSTFFEIFTQIEDIKSYYSGKKQKMSYFTFIEQLTENEEETSTYVKNSLLEIRQKLKDSNDFILNHSDKEMKLLNLDLEREVIEYEEEDEE